MLKFTVQNRRKAKLKAETCVSAEESTPVGGLTRTALCSVSDSASTSGHSTSSDFSSGRGESETSSRLAEELHDGDIETEDGKDGKECCSHGSSEVSQDLDLGCCRHSTSGTSQDSDLGSMTTDIGVPGSPGKLKKNTSFENEDTVYTNESAHDSSSGIASDDHNMVSQSSDPSTSGYQDPALCLARTCSSPVVELSPPMQRFTYNPDSQDDTDGRYSSSHDEGPPPYDGPPPYPKRTKGSNQTQLKQTVADVRARTNCMSPTRQLGYRSHPSGTTHTTHEMLYNKRNGYTILPTKTSVVSDMDKFIFGAKRKYRISYFDVLPDDVITRIFHNLPSNELCRCARVCRRWYSLVWDPTLWTSIRINNGEIDVNRALKVLTRRLSYDTPTVCVMVERINLNGCERLTDKGLHTIAKRCPELRHLEVQGCPNISNIVMFEVVSRCVNLEHLNVAGCPGITCICLTPEATVQATAYGKQIFIRYLDMTDCYALEDAGLQIIAAYCSQLVYLYLRRCTRITDLGVQYVANYCTNMKEFSISDCKSVTDFGLRELSKLEGNLRYLSVAKCDRISDVGVRYIAQYCRKLRYLNVRGCEGVSDESLELLAQCCQRLKSLDVGKCDVTDEGLQILAQYSPQLKKLSIKSCDAVTDAGVMSVAFHCRQLQQLNIQDCHLSVEAYRAVKMYCKRCIIEHTNPGFY